jgi:uncharacterized membrane protein YkvA (DUF1232 family)
MNLQLISYRLAADVDGRVTQCQTRAISILYVISPIDILPDVFVGLGQLDDMAILLLGTQLFIAVSPKDIVERIRAEIEGRPPSGGWTVSGSQPRDAKGDRSSASDEIIDG